MLLYLTKLSPKNNGIPFIITSFVPVCFLLLLLLLLPSYVRSTSVSCVRDSDCVNDILEGSKCVEGFCTNPFHYGGCLESLLPGGWNKKRVCGSDDPPEAVQNGHCRISQFQDSYMEIRILGQDWESSWFNTWILQILLTEILEVPVSVEGNAPGVNVDFYNIDSRTEYDLGFWYADQFVEGSKGDCRRFQKTSSSASSSSLLSSPIMGEEDEGDDENDDYYTPCAHLAPEVWGAGTVGTEPVRDLGALGQNRMFVPRFTMERDPSLVTYTGLGGEENRQKLASLFKRPTTWKQYCEEVSENNCQIPDEVASRPPESEEEGRRMFEEGVYTGHFRATDENMCDENPQCTGNIVDFPCGWWSHTLQQTHHLGIALKGSGDDNVGGYSIDLHSQIWAAANATKSDVVMVWWSPDSTYDKYIGTDAEMTPVILPPTTQHCVNNRAAFQSRCENDYETNIGNPDGACDYNAQFLKKAIAENLYQYTHSRDVPEALWSPAYDAIVNYEISHLELGDIFSRQVKETRDLGDFGSRDAVCRFVVENFDKIQSWIPPTYPRDMQFEDVSGDPLFITALVFASVAIALAVSCFVGTYALRKTAVMYHAQTEFLYLLLTGLLVTSVGAFIMVFPTTDEICVSIAWLTNIGYTFQLIPLVVRMHAILRLSGSGKAMQRIRLKPKQLFRPVFCGFICVSLFLLAWMLMDPPAKTLYYQIADQTNAAGETIVTVFDSCSSEESLFPYLNFGWKGLLLLLGSLLSIIAGSMKEDLNDTHSMSLLIYFHFFFLLMRVGLSFFLVNSDESNRSKLMGYNSMLVSFDVITAILVYFFPKFLARSEVLENKEPLPDLFLNASIMIADITGFSPWSSVREPVQVFKFLEEVYQTFDNAAEKHNVYKVETVREQYVAATGIPEQQSDHAVVITRFACECLKKMDVLVKHLEVKYGPDTADMTLRVGIHSGPVTGGYTKGKGARFQLFGDTMTTTSLIHSFSETGRIHLSDSTSSLLVKAGKKRWIRSRDIPIQTATKGQLKTYWVTKGMSGFGRHAEVSSHLSSAADSDADDDLDLAAHHDSEQRWIDFNVEVLKKLLKQIVHRREALRHQGTTDISGSDFNAVRHASGGRMPLDEVVEIIALPRFDKKVAKRQREIDEIELDEEALLQLKEYVTMISKMYNKNPFHNFAHASYVVMAIQKYLNRIIGASEIGLDDENRARSSAQAALHEHTYGITSDPLTQFACVFSALIHDVDHPGVPNPRLIEEGDVEVELYRKRSVAEQKSFDIAWNALMEKNFDKLRATICCDREEIKRFRQLVINSVMATDLGDKELKDLRNRRWQNAFKEDGTNKEESIIDVRNRKATIVIEHLIQAADVAHMCQHWSIYRKWNQRLFEECYKAYVDGRADKNPADGWYEGEIGFYDFYIIPLSEKLRDCGVFGPTSDENLNYARTNREMWEKEGKQIVAEMLSKVQEGRLEEVSEEDLSEDYEVDVV